MNRTILLPISYAIGLILILALAAQSRPQEQLLTPTPSGRISPMTFPHDYRETFVHYLTVGRSDDTVRLIFINAASLEAIERGEPFPVGTQILIEAYDAKHNRLGQPETDDEGRLIPGEMLPFIHVAEKRLSWPREAIASSTTLDGWNFETFDATTYAPSDENRADCFTCHDSGAFSRDFVFTRSFIEDYILNEETRYFFCNRPNRASCL